MNWQDAIRDIVLQPSITIGGMVVALALALLMGFGISWVYRRNHRGFSYNASFNLTLIMATAIVTAIMLAIGSNIALSLGLIGSLSIIRFRTVLKDSVDMAYLFWVIETGIAIGSGNAAIAIATFVLIGGTVSALKGSALFSPLAESYVLILQVDGAAERDAATDIAALYTDHGLSWHIRSAQLDTTTQNHELVYEITSPSIRKIAPIVLNKMALMSSIRSVSVLTPESNQYV